jgi:tetratricopeptide (TPR) repeat protein
MPPRIEQLQAILQREPNDAFCLYGLAMEYVKMGRLDEAIAHFDLAITANPRDSYVYFHKAKAQQQAGDIPAARESLRRGLEQARATADAKAMSEIAAFLDELA